MTNLVVVLGLLLLVGIHVVNGAAYTYDLSTVASCAQPAGCTMATLSGGTTFTTSDDVTFQSSTSGTYIVTASSALNMKSLTFSNTNTPAITLTTSGTTQIVTTLSIGASSAWNVSGPLTVTGATTLNGDLNAIAADINLNGGVTANSGSVFYAENGMTFYVTGSCTFSGGFLGRPNFVFSAVTASSRTGSFDAHLLLLNNNVITLQANTQYYNITVAGTGNNVKTTQNSQNWPYDYGWTYFTLKSGYIFNEPQSAGAVNLLAGTMRLLRKCNFGAGFTGAQGAVLEANPGNYIDVTLGATNYSGALLVTAGSRFQLSASSGVAYIREIIATDGKITFTAGEFSVDTITFGTGQVVITSIVSFNNPFTIPSGAMRLGGFSFYPPITNVIAKFYGLVNATGSSFGIDGTSGTKGVYFYGGLLITSGGWNLASSYPVTLGGITNIKGASTPNSLAIDSNASITFEDEVHFNGNINVNTNSIIVTKGVAEFNAQFSFLGNNSVIIQNCSATIKKVVTVPITLSGRVNISVTAPISYPLVVSAGAIVNVTDSSSLFIGTSLSVMGSIVANGYNLTNGPAISFAQNGVLVSRTDLTVPAASNITGNGTIQATALFNNGTFQMRGSITSPLFTNDGVFSLSGSLYSNQLVNTGQMMLYGVMNGSDNSNFTNLGLFQGDASINIAQTQNNGTIAPAQMNAAIGSIEFNGNVVFSDSSVLLMDVQDSSTLDIINTNKNAQLEGSLNITFLNSSYIPWAENFYARPVVAKNISNVIGNFSNVLSQLYGSGYYDYGSGVLAFGDCDLTIGLIIDFVPSCSSYQVFPVVNTPNGFTYSVNSTQSPNVRAQPSNTSTLNITLQYDTFNTFAVKNLVRCYAARNISYPSPTAPLALSAPTFWFNAQNQMQISWYKPMYPSETGGIYLDGFMLEYRINCAGSPTSWVVVNTSSSINSVTLPAMFYTTYEARISAMNCKGSSIVSPIASATSPTNPLVPIISSITSNVNTTGGEITIQGTNFPNNVVNFTVQLDGGVKQCTSPSVVLDSDGNATAIKCTVGAGVGMLHTASVVLAVPSCIAQQSSAVTWGYAAPQIANISAMMSLGGPVTITGINFGTGNISVSVDYASCSNCSVVVNHTKIVCEFCPGGFDEGHKLDVAVSGQTVNYPFSYPQCNPICVYGSCMSNVTATFCQCSPGYGGTDCSKETLCTPHKPTMTGCGVCGSGICCFVAASLM